MSYADTVDFLFRLQWHGVRMDLEPVERLLEAAGRPHDRYPTIHIGGTNGKGSTAAIIASVLQHAGYRVGLYTSPHLVDFCERIRIDGVPILPEAVVALTEELRGVMPDGLDPTFFDFTTAIAFLAFARSSVDVAVVEVGMGGRLDATNVVDPCVSVITNVAIDHQRYLGDSVAAIAAEKAGIIKPGRPVVTAAGDRAALDAIRNRAAHQGSTVSVVGTDVWVEGDSPIDFSYVGLSGRVDRLSCPLLGRHQLFNAASALAGLEHAAAGGLPTSVDAVRGGVASVRWEGRLEIVRERPYVVLDGAHNAAGASALASFLRSERARGRIGRLIVIFGILADKDLGAIVTRVGAVADEIVLTEPAYHRAAPVETLREAAASLAVPVHEAASVAAALAQVEARLGPHDWCVVTGSLYTVGEVKVLSQGKGRLSALCG